MRMNRTYGKLPIVSIPPIGLRTRSIGEGRRQRLTGEEGCRDL